MTMHLSTLPRPVSELYGPTRSIDRCSIRVSAGNSVALISDCLPAPDTPVTATITPSGISTETFRRLCSRAPVSLTQLVAARRVSGTSMRATPPLDVGGRALRDDAPAVAPGAGSEIHHPVGGLDRGLVVLDDEHGVAE